jgi:hypothetical protein
MALNPQFTNAVAQGFATSLLDALDAGSQAIIEIYDGAQPAQADDAITGTKLATLTCSTTSGVVSDGAPGGLLTFNAITADTNADDNGTATHARFLTQAAGTVIMDCSVGTANTDIILNTDAITAGATVSIATGGTITFSEGA